MEQLAVARVRDVAVGRAVAVAVARGRVVAVAVAAPALQTPLSVHQLSLPGLKGCTGGQSRMVSMAAPVTVYL